MSNNTSIKITATSDYNSAGKQWIARVTGPDRKWGCALDFVGSRSGKRGDYTSVTVIEPGLYKVRNTTRKGTVDSYVLVWHDGRELTENNIPEASALALVKGKLSDDALNAAGREVEIVRLEAAIHNTASKDPAEIVDHLGEKKTRAAVKEWRVAEIARLRAIGAPSDRTALIAERDRLVARLSQIETELEGAS